MGDYELVQYYNKIDLKTVNQTHYEYTTNLMIDRGLIVGERLKLTNYAESECEVF